MSNNPFFVYTPVSFLSFWIRVYLSPFFLIKFVEELKDFPVDTGCRLYELLSRVKTLRKTTHRAFQ